MFRNAWNPHSTFVLTGVFRVLGSTAVAFSSLVSRTLSSKFEPNCSILQAIALYTFIGVMVKAIESMWITLIVVVAFWVLDAILVILGFTLNHGHGELSYMAPAPVSMFCII